jgi:hypothetical protein
MVHYEHNPPQSSVGFEHPSGMQPSVLQDTNTNQGINPYYCPNPACLQDSRCYVDVAVVPDSYNTNTNMAGLGIFILNFQVQPTQAIYIKAQLNNCHSVLMGEAAALALGATIVKALQLYSCNFLSDSQQLVHFLHQDRQDHLSQWRIKPFTQSYSNIAGTLQAQLYKISRQTNITADTLAKQAQSSTFSTEAFHCNRSQCGIICSLLQALLDVNLTNVTILTAACCG